MTATKIADILIPEIWVPYVIEKTKEKSRLFQSGIVEQNAQIDEIANGGGNTANMPLFKDLSGDSEVLSDTSPLSVNKITTAQDICVKHFRGKVWGSNDLAQALAGADPLAAIGDLAADWWARDLQKILIASLKGVFAAASMSAHVVDISIPAGNSATDANKISATSTIDAFAALGDEGDSLTGIAMHSTLYWNLYKQDLITFESTSSQGKPIARYLGRGVVVDDSMPKEAGATNGYVYTSYLFGEGAIAYGEGNPKEAVETDRDSLQGEDYLINRKHFVLHPAGVKWQGTAAGTSPTNTELSTGTNWSRVYESKNVRIVALKTNG